MFILTECNNQVLGNILYAIKNFMNIIQIAGPILAILSASIILVKMVMNPEDKKLPKQLFNAGMALIMLFFIPLFVNVVINMAASNSDLNACWENATQNTGTSTYQDPYGNENNKKKPISNSSDYDGYVEKESNNNDDDDSTSDNSSRSTASKVVFIGDSRTVQMYAYLYSDWSGANYSSGGVHEKGDNVFIAQGSMGLSWMKSTGIPEAKKYFNSGSAIVILMGVNDLGNVDSYISYINSNVSSWESNGSRVYFGTVTPCDGSYSNLNSKINSFNSKIKSSLSGVDIIDLNSYLTSNGYTTTDGLHYDSSTAKKTYNYIKKNI